MRERAFLVVGTPVAGAPLRIAGRIEPRNEREKREAIQAFERAITREAQTQVPDQRRIEEWRRELDALKAESDRNSR